MNFHLLSAIARGRWAIDPFFALNQLPMLEQLMHGKLVLESDASNITQPVAVHYGNKKQSPALVAVTRLSGPLTKYDMPCGPSGMITLGEQLQQADADPAIMAHLLRVDSPGGTVDGTETLANTIKDLKKPVVAFVDGMAASAALWLISGADYVIASSDFDEIGSVGVLLSFADFQPAYEKKGVVFHDIVSSLSPEKIKDYTDLREGKYDNYIKEILDPIALRFQQVIRSAFPQTKDEHLGGKVFFAKDLLNVIVNEINSFEAALEKAAELASLHHNHQPSAMNPYPHLSALLDVPEIVRQDGYASLPEESLQSIEAQLESLAKAPAQMTTASSEQTPVAELLQQLENQQATITLLQEEVSRLRLAPAESTGTVIAPVDPSFKPEGPVVTDDMSLQQAMQIVKATYNL